MTKPPSRGYMVRDWMTVRMSSMGSGFWSISCCITTASTSDVYTFFSPKQRLVAGVKDRVRFNKMRPQWPVFTSQEPGSVKGWVLPHKIFQRSEANDISGGTGDGGRTRAWLTFNDGLHVALVGVDVVQSDQQVSGGQRGHGRAPLT